MYYQTNTNKAMKTKVITIAKGNTYPAKEALKAAGFTYGAGQWMFSGEFDVNIWTSKYANPTYAGRGNAKNASGVVFEVKTIID